MHRFLCPKVSRAALWFLAIYTWSTAGAIAKSAPTPSIEWSVSMQQVATLPPAEGLTLAFGDSDHDGKNEVALFWRDANFNYSYRIHELQESGAYTEEFRGGYLQPTYLGDLDKDGKSEIIGQGPSAVIQILESPTPASHPSQIVWTSPWPNMGFAAVEDTDRDGNMELILFRATGTWTVDVVIFENAGDDLYIQRASFPTAGGRIVVADLDGDGRIEIASAGTTSPSTQTDMFRVMELAGNDTWIQTFSDSSGNSYASNAVGGVDTDGNGTPEVFETGIYWDATQKAHWKTVVYEATANDQFARIASWEVVDGSSGRAFNALGNLDGTGAVFMMNGYDRIHAYRAVSPHGWTKIGEIIDPEPFGLHLAPCTYDIDNDGRDELFWPTNAASKLTLVLKHPGVLASDTAWEVPAQVRRLQISPNPCSANASIQLPGDGAGGWSQLAVFDAAGRRVERGRPVSVSATQLTWPTTRLRAGIYYVRLETAAGTPWAVGRIIVVR